MPKSYWLVIPFVLTALPVQAAVNFQGELIKPPPPRLAVQPSSRERTFDGGDFVIRVPDSWYAVGKQIPLGNAVGRIILNFGPQAATYGGLTVITEALGGRQLADLVAQGKVQQLKAIERFNERCGCVELVGNAFFDYHDSEGQLRGYWYEYVLHGERRLGHDYYWIQGDMVYQLHLFHQPDKLTESDIQAIVGSFRVRAL